MVAQISLKDVVAILKSSSKVVTLTFVTVKPSTDKNVKFGYRMYSANISANSTFQNSLVSSVCDYLEQASNEKKEKSFDALTQKEDWYESVPSGFVAEYQDFINSFGGIQVTQLSSKIQKSFYVLRVIDGGSEVYLIRRVNGLRKLNSSGVVATLAGNQLNVISSDVIGLDSVADLVMSSGKIFVLTHSALGALFNLRKAYADAAKKIIQPLKTSPKIVNYDLLETTVMDSLRLSKIVANMANKGRKFQNPLSNEPKVLATIKDFSLNVDYDKKITS